MSMSNDSCFLVILLHESTTCLSQASAEMKKQLVQDLPMCETFDEVEHQPMIGRS
jgi:hypothetical protein